MHRSFQRDKISKFFKVRKLCFRTLFFYNCGVLAAQLLRSQTKNSPQDCFLNAATVQQEIKIYLVISSLGRFLFRGFAYNCGVLAAQLLRSQTKNSPQDCFLNAATVQQEIKIYNFSKFGSYAFGLCFYNCGVFAIYCVAQSEYKKSAGILRRIIFYLIKICNRKEL